MPPDIDASRQQKSSIAIPKGRIGFPSLDMVDRDDFKYQTRSPYELRNAIISTDERYNDCFLLHSTVPVHSRDGFLKVIQGTEDSILQQPNAIGHCISADAPMSKSFADFCLTEILVSDKHAGK